MDNPLFDPKLFEYLQQESQRLLSHLSSENTQQALSQFQQQWLELLQNNATEPTQWLNQFSALQHQQAALWGEMFKTTNEASPRDTRVLEQLNHEIYAYVKQAYLITSSALCELANNAALPAHEQEKIAFYTKQYTDAMSPDNFAATNPEVIEEALKSNGQSLVNGLQNLLSDLQKGRISMTDESAFSLGDNIASTPGNVVFENELFQLIHYKPQTDTVFSRPTLIVPPCINKYYILDLQPHNSFVDYCCKQQQNTFLISWLNPSKSQGDISWDDYVQQGVIKAISVVNEISSNQSLNAVSWCVGGTLLASALAVLKARNEKPVQSATFLTTLIDFEQPGEISVFIDEPQINVLLQQAKREGVLSGRQLSAAFNMLRSTDLIWAYVVNNYLKGKKPTAFDILYWNGDSTNLPYKMYEFYITQMYLKNQFAKPNALTICDEVIDVSSIDIPCYFLSTIGDHIAPWKSTFRGVELLSGNNEFVLGASGHVAGVINPASKNKRHYWTGGTLDAGADNWLETATKQQGSWWPHWNTWLKRRAGKKVPVQVEHPSFRPIEPAPGRYVKVTID